MAAASRGEVDACGAAAFFSFKRIRKTVVVSICDISITLVPFRSMTFITGGREYTAATSAARRMEMKSVDMIMVAIAATLCA